MLGFFSCGIELLTLRKKQTNVQVCVLKCTKSVIYLIFQREEKCFL